MSAVRSPTFAMRSRIVRSVKSLWSTVGTSSHRSGADARASAPLRWEEVPDVDHNDFTLRTMRDRIAKVGDLTADIWAHPVSLLGLFKTLKLKDPVIDDRVLVKPSRMAAMSEEERKEMLARAKASGWNKGKSRWPPKLPPAE